MLDSTELLLLADTPENHARVQRIFEGAPNYALISEGKLPAPDNGSDAFSSLAPNGAVDDKSIFVIVESGKDVGVIDIYRRWNTPTKVMIGLLLVIESAQGRGIGMRAFYAVQQQIVAQHGSAFDTLRIGIVESNKRAFPFWRKLGFIETGERKQSTEFVGDVILFERPIT